MLVTVLYDKRFVSGMLEGVVIRDECIRFCSEVTVRAIRANEEMGVVVEPCMGDSRYVVERLRVLEGS